MPNIEMNWDISGVSRSLIGKPVTEQRCSDLYLVSRDPHGESSWSAVQSRLGTNGKRTDHTLAIGKLRFCVEACEEWINRPVKILDQG